MKESQALLETICVSCERPFEPNLDEYICDSCIKEAYRHKPERYIKLWLDDGVMAYVQPLSELASMLDAEFDGAEPGLTIKIRLIEMSRAEYEALPEFMGH